MWGGGGRLLGQGCLLGRIWYLFSGIIKNGGTNPGVITELSELQYYVGRP